VITDEVDASWCMNRECLTVHFVIWPSAVVPRRWPVRSG
jgi:RES domain-containing protein